MFPLLPTSPLSTRKVLTPASAARIAAHNPAPPEPTTRTSVSMVLKPLTSHSVPTQDSFGAPSSWQFANPF